MLSGAKFGLASKSIVRGGDWSFFLEFVTPHATHTKWKKEKYYACGPFSDLGAVFATAIACILTDD